MNKKFLAMAALALITTGAQAKVKLPHILGDNMILQQNTEASLWGWDKPGATVEVTTSWSGQKYSAKTGKDGKWLLTVKSPKASYTPLSISFDDGDGKVTVNNVLAGEVWVCAGQSNMEMPIKGFGNCPVEGYNQVVLEANKHKGIHYVKVPSIMSTKPLDDANCEWKEANADNVSEASATGYFFAKTVNEAIDVPVGLIMANKGGSRVESWLDRDYLTKNTKEDLDSTHMVNKFKWDFHYPLLWGNGTFNPILNSTVKGILFYQGCSNVGDPDGQYTQRLADLVAQWRRDFKQGDIPFYFVEIAPYWYDDADGTNAAVLREQQYKASKLIKNCGFIGNNDGAYAWEMKQIHPSQKRKVGERLAYRALTDTYGVKGLISKNPTFESLTVNGNEVIVKLSNTDGGIYPLYGIQGFEVAGADGKFHRAAARYDWHDGIIVSSEKVAVPRAVRYCFRNFMLGNARNQGGLPLIPFRATVK